MSERSAGVVFADISGTTRLYHKIGTSEAQRALERCVRRIERAIETYGGRILMPAVDELVASFPTADAAILAAMEMQTRIADLPPASGIKLSIRVGVHFGVLIENEDGFAGSAISSGRALLAIAGPHQILTCGQTAELLSPQQRRLLRSLDGMVMPSDDGECPIYELTWSADSLSHSDATAVDGLLPPPAPTLPPSSPARTPKPAAGRLLNERFCIRFKGKAYLVDAQTPSLTIGRDKSCDVVVQDRKASRIHVRLEKRGHHGFFLVDESTNGTFVAVGKSADLRLHNEEMHLTGSGRIAFGHATGSEGAEVAEFEAL